MAKNQAPDKSSPSILSESIAELSFEDALSELEEIVHKMEDNRISLEDSISSYEIGIQIIKHCQAKLNAAEKRIEILEKAPFQEEAENQAGNNEVKTNRQSKGIRKRRVEVNESNGEPVLSNKIQGSLLDFAD